MLLLYTQYFGDAVRIAEKILEQRPEEPQSFRDLAMALILTLNCSSEAKDLILARIFELHTHIITDSTVYKKFV